MLTTHHLVRGRTGRGQFVQLLVVLKVRGSFFASFIVLLYIFVTVSVDLNSDVFFFLLYIFIYKFKYILCWVSLYLAAIVNVHLIEYPVDLFVSRKARVHPLKAVNALIAAPGLRPVLLELESDSRVNSYAEVVRHELLELSLDLLASQFCVVLI